MGQEEHKNQLFQSTKSKKIQFIFLQSLNEQIPLEESLHDQSNRPDFAVSTKQFRRLLLFRESNFTRLFTLFHESHSLFLELQEIICNQGSTLMLFTSSQLPPATILNTFATTPNVSKILML